MNTWVNGWLLGYLVLGAGTGLFAGLLGVGGGAVMVPVLALLFKAQGYPQEHLMHVALGTSMAAILFTSLSSMRTHHRHGAVLWPVVRAFSPGIVVGTFIGAQAASLVPTKPLALGFCAFISYVAIQLFVNKKPQPSRQLPGPLAMAAVGVGIGGVSSLVAIGGGALSIPFMTWCNVKMHNAVGTSSAIGFPIAVSGAAGYLISGWGVGHLPDGTLGFISLPALFGTVATSIVFAPIGAGWTHRLPAKTLKIIYASVLVVLVARMLYGLFGGAA